MKKAAALAMGMMLWSTIGCHSAFVEADVRNHTQKTISLLEVDYPSASFGTQTLAPGAEFRYRFKVLGSGPAKVIWTNTAEAQRETTGPDLAEGDEGMLVVTVKPEGVEWTPEFKNRTLAASFSSPKPLMMPK